MNPQAAVFERVSQDMADGRLWKARDRLRSLVNAQPSNPEALELLGEVYFRMGDQPNAGRFWLLTERSGSDVASALQAFEERWGGDLGEKLKMVPASEPLDAYPPPVRERLNALLAQAREAGIEWPHQTGAPSDARVAGSAMSGREWISLAGLAVLGPGLWLLGIACAIYLIVGWLS